MTLPPGGHAGRQGSSVVKRNLRETLADASGRPLLARRRRAAGLMGVGEAAMSARAWAKPSEAG